MAILKSTLEPPEIVAVASSAQPQQTADASERIAAPALSPQAKGLWSFWVALATYLGVCCYLLNGELRATGTLTFPLDDTYITMALSKNLAFHGVWGLGHSGFQSASSCPGFMLMLAAAFRVFGPSQWMPLSLSVALGVCAVFMAHRLLAKEPAPARSTGLLAIVCFVPLPVIGILGMEHTLHLFLVLLFLHLFSLAYARHGVPDWPLLLLACAMTSVRYESLFIVLPACMLLAARKQMGSGILLGLAALAPVLVTGTISIAHGAYWLPASIALKGISGNAAAHSPLELARHFATMTGRAPYMGGLLLAMLALLMLPEVWNDSRRRALLAIVSGATVLHLCLADVGWVYRYEAYLVGAAIAAIASAASCFNFRGIRHRWVAAAFVPVMAAGTWFLFQRTAEAIVTIPLRSLAIYCQQIQMARFLARFEPGAVVAANDIGAISYFADIDCVDLIGIANKDVFRLRRQSDYNTRTLADLAAKQHVKIAIVYDSWFSNHPIVSMGGPPLPATWIRVERWLTPNGIFLGDSVVSFYATNPSDAAVLSNDLAHFDPSLPAVDRIVR